MNATATALLTILGAALVSIVLRDVFHELLHPSGAGSLSGGLMKVAWRVYRRLASRRPAVLVLAGPSVFLAVIVGWAAMLAVGWALVIWPYLPEAFLFSTGLDPSSESGFVDALYLSLVTLTTLGYGDVVPTNDWLRVLLPLEAMVGFGLLTAAISWLLSIYPVLSRRRSLAQEVALIREAESRTASPVTRMSAAAAERMLDTLASRLISARGDLSQFPITYYFHGGEEQQSLAAALPELIRLSEELGGAGSPVEVRLRAAMLSAAIDDLAAMLASRFLNLPSAPTGKILSAYAHDHLRTPPEEDSLDQDRV